ncbi:MAG: plastocyanin/azurin family copper-binding protein [Caldilineaceae bacterium]|nr:hypothetical protein [Caldilineaceae bacterium]
MQRMRLILAIVALLVIAACGGSDSDAPAADSAAPVAASDGLRVEMHDIYFGDSADNLGNPPVWAVTAGESVSIELANVGNLEHNWAIVKKGEEVPVPYTGGAEQEALLYYVGDVVPAGVTETHTFTAPAEIGEYLVICTVAGHYPAMQGKLQVQ